MTEKAWGETCVQACWYAKRKRCKCRCQGRHHGEGVKGRQETLEEATKEEVKEHESA